MNLLFAFLFAFQIHAADKVDDPKNPDGTKLSAAEQVHEDRNAILQRLNPFYAAYGNNDIKVQVSFKTPMVRDVPFYFGYTQLMFYDFLGTTHLFTDLTYNPQFFYQQKLNWGAVTSLDIAPFDHDSNGKPLPDHRSYNDAYLRLNFLGQGKKWVTHASVAVQYLYAFEQTNTDIQDYIGPLILKASFIRLWKGNWFDQTEFELQAIPGGKFAQSWDHGGYQASLSFRLGAVSLVPAFYVQYYEGFAETLLNYNQRVNRIRVGVVF